MFGMDEEEAVVDEDDAVVDQDENSIVDSGIFPWSMCELLHREFLNMWQPTLSVHFYLGNGQEALAHVREKKMLVAFGATAAHITFVKEYCIAAIIYEQVNGIDAGFRCRRFLTRAESLGGADAGVGAKAIGSNANGAEADEAKASGAISVELDHRSDGVSARGSAREGDESSQSGSESGTD
jgi:hypothetical protein